MSEHRITPYSEPWPPKAPRALEHAADVRITGDVVVFREPRSGELFTVSGMLFEALAGQRDARRSRGYAESTRTLDVTDFEIVDGTVTGTGPLVTTRPPLRGSGKTHAGSQAGETSREEQSGSRQGIGSAAV